MTFLLSLSSHLFSEMKTSRNGSWKASLFIRPDYVMPSLLAFLLPAKGERFSHLAVDSFNAITGRTVSTDWMGRVPASVADVGRGMSHTASARSMMYLCAFVMIWIGLLSLILNPMLQLISRALIPASGSLCSCFCFAAVSVFILQTSGLV